MLKTYLYKFLKPFHNNIKKHLNIYLYSSAHSLKMLTNTSATYRVKKGINNTFFCNGSCLRIKNMKIEKQKNRVMHSFRNNFISMKCIT